MQINFDKVIEELAIRVGILSKENAVLRVMVEQLQSENSLLLERLADAPQVQKEGG